MNHKSKNKSFSLGADTTLALRRLISITRGLMDFAEQEERAMALGDTILLSSLQDSKETLALEYAHASAEFRSRIEEFRSADRNLINELEKLQNALGEKVQSNNVIFERLHRRALANTQATLVTAQELGQPVQYKRNHQHEQREGL